MAPHDYRRLLLAHRDASPAYVPARIVDEPSRAPRAFDVLSDASGSRVPLLADSAEPGTTRPAPALRSVPFRPI